MIVNVKPQIFVFLTKIIFGMTNNTFININVSQYFLTNFYREMEICYEDSTSSICGSSSSFTDNKCQNTAISAIRLECHIRHTSIDYARWSYGTSRGVPNGKMPPLVISQIFRTFCLNDKITSAYFDNWSNF